MNKLLQHLIIGLLLTHPLLSYASECTAPPMVADFMTKIEERTFYYQELINADGIQCQVERRDADLIETPEDASDFDEAGIAASNFATEVSRDVEASALTISNEAASNITQFFSNMFRPRDYLDGFLQAVPFIDRPYALTYDLDRIQTRLDQLWDQYIKATKFCQFQRADVMAEDYKSFYNEFRLIRNADSNQVDGVANPYFVAHDPTDANYATYAKTGFYKHPSQQACSNGELNLAQIGAKLERLSQTLSNATEEVGHEFQEEIKGIETSWKEIDRQGQEFSKGFQSFLDSLSPPKDQKSAQDIISELQQDTAEAISAETFLTTYENFQTQEELELNIQTMQDEIRAVYSENAHASLRIQEQELDNIVRVLQTFNANLEANNETTKAINEKQAQGIPSPFE